MRSDLSAYHRVDYPESMAADRMWRLTERLHHYGGAITAAVRASIEDVATATTEPDPILTRPVSPRDAEGLLRSPVYGSIPGLGPAFSISYAPLAEGQDEVSDGGRD